MPPCQYFSGIRLRGIWGDGKGELVCDSGIALCRVYLPQAEWSGQFGEGREQIFRFGEHLHRYMVGAGVEVLSEPPRDGLSAAVGDQCIDEAVATRFGEVLVGEAESLQAVEVIRQAEVKVQ